MIDRREMKLDWTPEMVEAVRNMKGFDYKKIEDIIKKHSNGPKEQNEGNE